MFFELIGIGVGELVFLWSTWIEFVLNPRTTFDLPPPDLLCKFYSSCLLFFYSSSSPSVSGSSLPLPVALSFASSSLSTASLLFR